MLDQYIIPTRRHQPVVIRRVSPGDAEHIGRMLSQLSERSRSLRYMTSRPLTAEFAQQEATRIARGYTANHITLLATAQHHGNQAIIGVGELVRDAQQPTVGECALIVCDAEQGNGIGGRLFRCLADMAPTVGITTLRAEVLPENRAVRALIRKSGIPYSTTYHYGALEFILRLPPHDPQATNCYLSHDQMLAA